MVLVLFDVRPSRRQVDVAAQGHHHGDVATVGNRSIEQTDGNAATVGAGVALGDHHDPLAGLDAGGPFEGGVVHATADCDSISLNARNGVQHDGRIDQTVGVELVRHGSFNVDKTCCDFNVR